jgi:short-subunit dehydrogenase
VRGPTIYQLHLLLAGESGLSRVATQGAIAMINAILPSTRKRRTGRIINMAC